MTNLHVSSHFAFHNWGLSEKVAQKSYPRNLTDICKRLDHVNVGILYFSKQSKHFVRIRNMQAILI